MEKTYDLSEDLKKFPLLPQWESEESCGRQNIEKTFKTSWRPVESLGNLWGLGKFLGPIDLRWCFKMEWELKNQWEHGEVFKHQWLLPGNAFGPERTCKKSSILVSIWEDLRSEWKAQKATKPDDNQQKALLGTSDILERVTIQCKHVGSVMASAVANEFLNSRDNLC